GDTVARRNAGPLADLAVQTDDGTAVHPRDRRPERVAVDRHPDRRTHLPENRLRVERHVEGERGPELGDLRLELHRSILGSAGWRACSSPNSSPERASGSPSRTYSTPPVCARPTARRSSPTTSRSARPRRSRGWRAPDTRASARRTCTSSRTAPP